jgi:flagellar biosynthetic protein FlhB
MAASGFRLLCGFVGIALLFALLDQFVARRMFLKQMRMSRRELRREHREREGEPRIKQKRKQLHAQFAKAAEGLRAVRGSDVVITNPTHLAVALRYDQETMAAPIVTAKGAQSLAGRIRSLAFTYGVTTIEDKPLAQDLYRRCATGSPIPEDQYRRVADIYRQLRAVRAGQGNAHA